MIKRLLQETPIAEAYHENDVWLGYGYNYVLDKWFASHNVNETVQWNPPWFLGTPLRPREGHCIVMVGLKPDPDMSNTRSQDCPGTPICPIQSRSINRYANRNDLKLFRV